VGIYPNQVKADALRSGNANVLVELNNKSCDLRNFYLVVGSKPNEVNFDSYLRYGSPCQDAEGTKTQSRKAIAK
jgi:hypothetical protein